jgi:ABC-2 type transport system permease protein
VSAPRRAGLGTTVAGSVRVVRAATATARADLAVIYTWRTWLFGWLVRILAQVTFFALIGRLLGSQAIEHYLIVGNAVAICVLESMMVVASTTWERAEGTLPLLVAAPGSLPAVFIGRSVQWIADGTVCASIAFFAVGAAFGLPLRWPGVLLVVPLILIISVSTYCFGLCVAALVLRVVGLRNAAANVVYLALIALTGAEVPRSVFPRWLTVVTDGMPVTHGLTAVRDTVAGRGVAGIASSAGLELVVGVIWLVVAMQLFRRFADGGRRTGSIEFT